jgi:hypothetical protein
MTMKKLSFAVAMLAAVSMVVTPVAPSLAQEVDRYAPAMQQQAVSKMDTRQKIAHHAARGEAAILSKAQVDRLARTNPKLHARLMAAYNSGTVPSLTQSEKKMLAATTQANLKEYKAGGPAGVLAPALAITAFGWFAFGLIGFVALLIFLYWVAPNIFRPRPLA